MFVILQVLLPFAALFALALTASIFLGWSATLPGSYYPRFIKQAATSSDPNDHHRAKKVERRKMVASLALTFYALAWLYCCWLLSSFLATNLHPQIFG